VGSSEQKYPGNSATGRLHSAMSRAPTVTSEEPMQTKSPLPHSNVVTRTYKNRELIVDGRTQDPAVGANGVCDLQRDCPVNVPSFTLLGFLDLIFPHMHILDSSNQHFEATGTWSQILKCPPRAKRGGLRKESPSSNWRKLTIRNSRGDILCFAQDNMSLLFSKSENSRVRKITPFYLFQVERLTS